MKIMLRGVIHHSILIICIIISMMLIYGSMLKFVDPMWENQFAVWGYSKTFLMAVAVYELIVGILVFIPALRAYGLGGVLLLMVGAIYTHVNNFEYEELPTAIFLIGMSVASFILMRMKKKIDNENKLLGK